MTGTTRNTKCAWKAHLTSFSIMTLVAVVVASALASCAGIRTASVDSGSWTVCLYLCGSNLESRQSWGTKTLDEICRARIPANTNVIIQAGGSKDWHSNDVTNNGTRLVVENHMLKGVGEAGDASMGESSTLADFLEFCAKAYPADHMAVVLWDHGGGPLKGACYDETHNYDALTLAELDEAIAKGVQSRGGTPYDIVGFDACLMGSLEVASMLSDDALWLVASEEIEAGAGWDYTALFEALKESPGASKVGEAICDGYLEKCAKRKKDKAATLAVVDLSKVGEVEQALDAAIAGLEDEKDAQVQVLRHLVFGTRYAESFGGSTLQEGRSNLVDLKGMAEGNAEGSADGGAAWLALAEAVDEAVTYRVCGSTTTGANGLSLWYPQVLSEKELRRYTQASPLVSYAQSLNRLYGGSIGEVRFEDAGSSTDTGRLSVTIDPADADEFFDLYVVNGAVDGSYQDTNVDIADDWEHLTFSYGPARAVAITLDGMVLDATLVSYENEYELFSAPVTVDGEDQYLRIAWIWNDEEPEGGHYELLGVWNGVDHVTGIADRSDDSLEAGAVVGALSLRTGKVREEVVVGDEVAISDQPLAPGRYECYFVALDLYGHEYTSDLCTYEVDDKGATTIVSIGSRSL